MKNVATPSKWDSDVFGVRVGRIRAPSPPDPSEVREANKDAFDVVFVVCEGWHEPSGAVAVDHRFDMETSAIPAQEPPPVGPPKGARMREVLELAGTAFSDSRFLRDPRLAGRTGDFYMRWCSDAAADGRLLARVEGPTAFCVFGDEGAGWRVVLIAVAAGARGAGVGRGLLAGVAERLGIRRPIRVRVSARNHRAIRSYESSHFRVESVSTAWHIWI